MPPHLVIGAGFCCTSESHEVRYESENELTAPLPIGERFGGLVDRQVEVFFEVPKQLGVGLLHHRDDEGQQPPDREK